MSNAVFPWPVVTKFVELNCHRAIWTKTTVMEAQGGAQQALSWWPYPRYRYGLGYERLQSDAAFVEYQSLLGFLARNANRWDTFLFQDPEDNAASDMGFGAGDGVKTSFQLQRAMIGTEVDSNGYTWPTYVKPRTNYLINSSFEVSSGGLATNWSIYNNSSATEPATSAIVPGLSGGSAQRVSWGKGNTATKGVFTATALGTNWREGTWYTISYYARASGTNVGQTMELAWNAPSPFYTTVVSNPPLSAQWQRYVFNVYFAVGAGAIPNQIYFMIHQNSGTYGDLDFDLAQVETGTTATRPIENNSTTLSATSNPIFYGAGSGSPFEPIFDLAAPPTLYVQGPWQDRDQLYPYPRTNLCPRSAAFDDSAWSKSNVTVTADTVTGPDGVAPADTITDNATNALHYVTVSVGALTIGSRYVYSAFVKAGTKTTGWLSNSGNNGVSFDLAAGTVVAIGAALSPAIQALRNGWFRVSFADNAISAGGFNVGMGAFGAYAGTGQTIYAWGAQVEVSLSPTPAIQTAAAAVTVTDYALSSQGLVTLPAPLASGLWLAWDGSYYRRVRLAEDLQDAERIYEQAWKTGLIELESVIS